jgi:potassium/hydrogen antiporter
VFAIESLLLLGGVLTLLGILSSKLSSHVSVPVLVLFLAVGMLAGSEGIGGIEFENYALAHAVGTLALALILFDGGLRTPVSALRSAWKPAVLLATAGVAFTALITGATAAWLVGLPILHGLLLGAIVSSTDAAAVFAILRGQGVRLPERLGATLEVESGSNDPMAIFLTVGIIQVALGEMAPGLPLLGFFLLQMGAGAGVGLGMGWVGTKLVNRVHLDAAGLYPILAATLGILSFGVAHLAGGNGFLAIYLTGIVMGNSPLVFRRGILLFHDGAAWMAQIAMFVVLGLLSFPSALAAAAPTGLLVAGVLTFVARPVMVFTLLGPFGFSFRELLLLSWAGLKGAVPIILAIYPLLAGLPDGRLIFDLVFFTVLVSALSQGWSLPAVARWLGLERPPEPAPPVTLDITSLKHVDADIVEYAVRDDSRAAGLRIRDLPFPDGALVAMVARANRTVPPGGNTEIRPGDFVFVIMNRDLRPLVDRLFTSVAPELPHLVEFPLKGTTTAGELLEFYGLALPVPEDTPVGRIVEQALGSRAMPGDFVELDECVLVVREVVDGRVVRVGLEILTDSPGGD